MIVSDQASPFPILECNLFQRPDDKTPRFRWHFWEKIERRLKGRWTEFCKDVYLDYSDEDSIRITKSKVLEMKRSFVRSIYYQCR